MIEYQFIDKMLCKQRKHLEGVKKHVEFAINDYDRQIASLEKLDQAKYGGRLKEMRFKLAEAFEKLSHIEPNIMKIDETVEELRREGLSAITFEE